MPKEIFHHIPQLSLSKKNAGLDQNLSLIIKMSNRWDPSEHICKLLKGYRIQNITQTLELFESAEENHWDDAAVESFTF